MRRLRLEERLPVLQPLGEDAAERPHVHRAAVALLAKQNLGRAVPARARKRGGEKLWRGGKEGLRGAVGVRLLVRGGAWEDERWERRFRWKLRPTLPVQRPVELSCAVSINVKLEVLSADLCETSPSTAVCLSKHG
eukprot:5361036-Pleurochrysis_carterae.AAC.2